MCIKVCIEKAAYEKFMTDYNRGLYGKMRLGQAFYNRFKLDASMSRKIQFDRLYNAPDAEAKGLIAEYFEFN